eukprot:362719-Chlamydomonas_euryale.AAC.2
MSCRLPSFGTQWAVAPKSAVVGATVGLLLDLPVVTFYRWMLDVVADTPPSWLSVIACGACAAAAFTALHVARLTGMRCGAAATKAKNV